LSEIAQQLGLKDLTPELSAEKGADVAGGHASDLLSDVLANAPRGGVLVTIQMHMNVIAVSVHAELAAVVFAWGRAPEEAVRKRAAEERIQLYVSALSTFEIVGRLYALGLRGHHA
jgi:hypothetical protein